MYDGAETVQLIPGGMANLNVLGGNLPPSFATCTVRTIGVSWAHWKRLVGSRPRRASGPRPNHIIPLSG